MSIYEFATKEFEKRYDSTFTVWINQPKKVGNITKMEVVPAKDLSDIPCRVSQRRLGTPTDGAYAGIAMQTTLFCNPSHQIKPGSKISVTDRYGMTKFYDTSSDSFASYATHQEIIVILGEKA